MKFAEHLSAHLTPEWRKQYIDYEALKKMLHVSKEQAPVSEVTEPLVIQRYHMSLEERFFQISEKELTKINTFYAEKLAEAQRRLATLQSELEVVLDVQKDDGIRALGHHRRNVFYRPHKHRARHKTMCDLKLALSELYLSLILLQNYQNLNVTGFYKILKKYDKMFATVQGAGWRAVHVEISPVYTSKKIDQLITEVESLYTHHMENGDRAKAMKRLRVPPLGVAQPTPVWTTFRVGMECGLIVALAVLIIIKGIYVSQRASLWPLLRVYRGGFIIIEFIFLLGINIYGWRKAGVNHTLIFELDPRNNLSHQHLFELAGLLGILWCLSLLACLFHSTIHTPMQVNPLVLYGFMLFLLINPTKTFYYKSRVWLLKLLFRICTAPFHKVGFADFWLADQLNSMGPVLLDMWTIICFYTYDVDWESEHGLLNPPAEALMRNSYASGVTCFIQCIPPWIRFAQCLRRYRDSGEAFPHLANAGKYSTVFIMVTFAALYSTEKDRSQLTFGVKIYFYLWAVTACVSTIVTVGWDLKMDWGLLDKKTKENKFLREDIVYQYKANLNSHLQAYYYCAVVQDVILRIAWVLNIIFVQMKRSDVAEIVTTVFGPLEVFRRFVWNFFRLENEHLNNCGHFRAVRDISVAPLYRDNQAALERMMDLVDVARHDRKIKDDKRKTSFSFKRSRVKIWDTKVHIEETEEESAKS